jgi:hypothetical protein
MIGNFLDNTKTTCKVSVPSKTKADTSATTANQFTKINRDHNHNRTTAVTLQKSSISSLTIQLGAFVPHSSAVAIRAEKLFKQILDVLQRKKLRERINGLQDIQRHQEVYEAACFYLIATNDAKGGSRSHGASNDNENDKQLDLATFLDATKSFTKSQFQMVLNYVTELWEEIQDHKIPQQTSSSRSSTNITDRKDASITASATRKRARFADGSSQPHDSTKTKRLNSKDTAESMLELVMQRDCLDQDVMLHNKNSDTKTNYSPLFLEWKKKCIEAACLSAKEKTEKDDDGGANDDYILDLAVREILKRRDLLA